jgi:DNA-binding MarR family transcriptional regulator
MSPVSTEARIALAWRELRRGASGTALRSYLSGPDGPRLEQAQLDALEILASNRDGLAMSDFADSLRVDPSTATRAVDRLQRLGLAERVQQDDDRRYVLARATPEGIRTIRRISRLRALGMQRLLETFDDDEREQFASYLERFVDSIDRLVEELADGTNRTGTGRP